MWSRHVVCKQPFAKQSQPQPGLTSRISGHPNQENGPGSAVSCAVTGSPDRASCVQEADQHSEQLPRLPRQGFWGWHTRGQACSREWGVIKCGDLDKSLTWSGPGRDRGRTKAQLCPPWRPLALALGQTLGEEGQHEAPQSF